MTDQTLSTDVRHSQISSENENLNRILFIIVICVSIPSILINLFSIYRLHPSTKLSVFVFRCVLHVSFFYYD